MRVTKTKKFKDYEGDKIEKTFDNGLKETILTKPTAWYIEHKLVPAQKDRERQDKREEKAKRIQEKLIEMAERELAEEK